MIRIPLGIEDRSEIDTIAYCHKVQQTFVRNRPVRQKLRLLCSFGIDASIFNFLEEVASADERAAGLDIADSLLQIEPDHAILQSMIFSHSLEQLNGHDKKKYTADTWRVMDSDGILGNDYRRIVDSFYIGISLSKNISKPIGHISVSSDKADLPRLTDDFMTPLAK